MKLTKEQIAAVQRIIDIETRRFYSLGPQEMEDMASMAWVTVLERLPRWDEKKSKLATFAQYAVRSALADWYRRYYKPRNLNEEQLRELRAMHRTEALFASEGTEQNHAQLELNELCDDLTGRDAHILEMYMQGTVLKDIGNQLGITESRTSQIINEITAKMKNQAQRGRRGNKQKAKGS